MSKRTPGKEYEIKERELRYAVIRALDAADAAGVDRGDVIKVVLWAEAEHAMLKHGIDQV